MIRLVALSACAIALSVAIWLSPGKHQPIDSGDDQSNSNRQASIRASDALPRNPAPDQITADTEQQTKAEYFGGWLTKENAPDWIMAVITFFGIGIAIWQISEAKTAVMLTERADMLMDSVSMTPRHEPYTLSGETKFSFAFKNFGPTRASVKTSILELEIEGAIPKKVDKLEPPIPETNVGAGDLHVIAFPKLGVRYTDEDIRQASRGDKFLKFRATIHYVDVFGKPHHTKCLGTYYGELGTFITEGPQEAN